MNYAAHHHESHNHQATGRRLGIALGLTAGLLAVEGVAGVRANSLAVLSDAGHILTDVFALGLAWFALRLARLPANEKNTFGYQRTGILAALLNAAILLLVGASIAVEATLRLGHPQHVEGYLVMGAAAAAILVNGYIAITLHQDRLDNLNVRAAFLHVVGDIAASVGVLLSGMAVVVWHVYIVDPLLSLFIAALIGVGAWSIVKDTLAILMEAIPRDVDLSTLVGAMREVPGVQDVHDLHVWALSDGFRLLSAHVAVPEQSLADTAHLLSDLKLVLRIRFGIEHATIELECIDCTVPQPRRIELLEWSRERPASRA